MHASNTPTRSTTSPRAVAAIASVSLLAGLALATPATATAVTAATRATTVAIAPARPVAGVKVTLRATVSPAVSSGTVRFSAAGTTLASCGARPVSKGAASCATTFATKGTRTVTVRYSGTATYKASSASRSVTVAAKPVATPPPTVVGGTGSCTSGTGSLVGVSFGPWGGPVARGCAVSPTSGRTLLTGAGFTVANVSRFPGFVCRIGSPLYNSPAQYPTTTQDPCVNTPPASAYWSFWTAAKGVNTWTYSPTGADDDRPTSGGVELWTYGSTDVDGATGRPSVTPAQVRSGLPSALAASNRTLGSKAAPGKADVAAAEGYLVGELVDGTHYEPFGGPDYGLTADAALALAAGGGRDATLSDLTDYLADHAADYTFVHGTSDFSDADGGTLGKLALLAETTGRDPRDFGGIDLVAGLRQVTCTKADPARQCGGRGAYQYTSSLFGQTLGVLAQLRAGDTAQTPVAYLESLQTRSGGFAADASGSYVETDSTAMAAMALALVPGAKARAAVAKALAWLAGRQRSDGGFPGAAGNSINSAALARQALSLDAETYSAAIAKAGAFLAASQNGDGGFDVAVGTEGSDVRASAQALGGAVGTPFGSVLDDLGSGRDAATGGDYLVDQLVGGDHYTGSYDPDGDPSTDNDVTFDDQGLTADGVFALLATGGHQDAVDRMVAYLTAQVGAYADPTGAFGGPYSGSLAKLALVAEATGGDPHSFGDTDLLGILRDKVCTAADAAGTCTAEGDFFGAYSQVSQALGVLALQASPVAADHLGVDSAPVVRLRQLQCADGGFTSSLITGTQACVSEVDSTGFAIQALATVPGTDAVLGRAQHYLEDVQESSGLFPGAAGANSNSTALAAVGLQTLVTALHSRTVDPPGPKTTAPVHAWQSALTGLRTLAAAKGGYGITTADPADLRSSAQAVLAAAQGTLVGLSGARIASTPRDAAVDDPGTPSPAPTSGTPSSPAPANGSASPIGAGNPADTGVSAGTQLLWAAVLLLLGSALAFAGRRRVADVVGRHRPTHAR